MVIVGDLGLYWVLCKVERGVRELVMFRFDVWGFFFRGFWEVLGYSV